MHESFDPTIIIFAVLAIFVVWKLRSVLGTRTGNEKPPYNPFERKAGQAEPSRPDNVVPLPGAAPPPASAVPPSADRWKGFAEPESPTWEGLDAIAAVDPGFAPGPFLEGAKAAYEMVVTAFAKGDREMLRNLLSKEVFDSFDAAISSREERGETAESTFVTMDKAAIQHAQMRDRLAQVTVLFETSLINATRNKAGEVVDGDPEKVVAHHDIWTFARDVGSRDPNWKLVATDSPA